MAKMRAYFKLDLYFFEHPKIVDLSHSAIVLYVAGIAYSNRRETDGFIARPVVRRLIDLDEPAERTAWEVADELVKAGLWEEARPGFVQTDTKPRPPDGPEGFWIHDFLDHNESNEERTQRRDKDAARKRHERESESKPAGQAPSKTRPRNVQPDTSGRPSGRERPSEPVRPIAVTEQSTSSSTTPFPSPSPTDLAVITGVGAMPVDNPVNRTGREGKGRAPRTPRHRADPFVVARAREVAERDGPDAARAYLHKVDATYGQASQADQLARLDEIIAQDQAAEAGQP